MDKETRKRAINIKKIREKANFMKLGGKLRAYFFTGILVTAPVAITVYLAYEVILFIDKMVSVLVDGVIPQKYAEYLPMTVPGIGILILIIGFVFVGMFAAGFVGRFFLKLGEWIVYKVPLISSVYSMLKQVFETFFSNKANSFKQVVLLEYPRRGIWIYGFLSGEHKGEASKKSGEELLNVFIPTTPNPTSGFLIFVPKKDVQVVDISVEDALKFIISCGVIEPGSDKGKKQKK